MNKSKIKNLLFYVISAELIGILSAYFTGNFSDFFLKYKAPPLLPPAWIFPVVWSILYVLMGFSAHIISDTDGDFYQKNRALLIYWFQLAVNFIWSIFFFRFELMKPGAAIIIFLIFLVSAMIYSFKYIRASAAYLNIPYLIWLIFALYLNIATIIVN